MVINGYYSFLKLQNIQPIGKMPTIKTGSRDTSKDKNNLQRSISPKKLQPPDTFDRRIHNLSPMKLNRQSIHPY